MRLLWSRVRWVWLVCLTGLMASAAQYALAVAQADSAQRGVLWKVERQGETPSYVFGTVHSEDPRVLHLPAAVRAALADSRSVTLEVDLGAANMRKMSRAMYFADGRNLRSVLGEPLYRDSVRLMAQYGIGEAQVETMKPWALLATLSTPRPENGVFLDLALYRNAVDQGKPVYGLERIEEQIGYFDAMPQADQIALLKDAVYHHDRLPAMFDELLNAYLARDLDALMRINERYLHEGDAQLAARFMVRFVDQRNRLMVERMQPRLREGRAFVAVGALHLPGPRGILRLLEQRGYRVSAVY